MTPGEQLIGAHEHNIKITQKHQGVLADVEADKVQGLKEWVGAGSGTHIFGLSMWEAEAGRSLSSKPVWTTDLVILA